MGKKIDSIIEMHNLGLPAPRCIFIMEDDDVNLKLDEYFSNPFMGNGLYTVRTDREDDSMSCKRILTSTKEQTIQLAHEWHKDFQIILQEFIDERNEVKSGNFWIKDREVIIEGAMDKHINFTNGKSLEINARIPRYDSYCIEFHKRFINQKCFSQSELYRLVRLSRRVPYNNVVVEFSFFNNGSLYFWEIKKEKNNAH